MSMRVIANVTVPVVDLVLALPILFSTLLMKLLRGLGI